MILGSLIIYGFGVIWLKYSLGIPWLGESSAWAYGVRDFLVGDFVKVLIAAGLLPVTWRILRSVGPVE